MSEKPVKRKRRPVWLRVLKWTGITIGTLIVLIIIAIFVIPLFVNTGVIKHEIERVASHETGRNITIAGHLSLSLFPWVGFDAHDVTMSNARGFGAKPFMHAKEAEIHVKVLPLIFHHVEVSGIVFDTPALNLARQRNGRDNWRDLTGGTPAQGTRHEKNNAPLAHLSIGYVAINNGTLDYTDAENGKHYTIKQFGLKASHLEPGKPFPLSFRTELASDHPHFKATIKFDATAEFDKAASRISLAKGTLGATVTSFGGNKPLKLNANWKRFALDANAGTATLAGLLVACSDVRARLDATAKRLDGKPEVAGHLDVAPFSPRKLLAALGNPVPRGFQGFNRASLTANLKATSNALSLTDLVLKLDNSTLTGSAGIPNLSQRSLDFDLALDRLDLADYIVTGSGAKTRIGAPHGKSLMQTRLPGRLLKNLALTGTLSIGQLAGFGIQASDLALTLSAANGKLSVAPIQAKLYSGNYRGTITLTPAGRGMHLETADALKSIDLAGLIGTLTGTKRLSGTSDVKLALAGEGTTVGELLGTLKGEADLSIVNGALKGVSLWDTLRGAWLAIKEHRPVPPAAGPRLTKILNLKAHSIISRGKLTTDTLVARLPFLAVSGHGSIDFFQHGSVDYRLLATVLKTPAVSDKRLSELEGTEVPIRVSGSLGNLSVYPDIEAALKARAKSKVKKNLDKKKQDLKEKLLRELPGHGDNDGNSGG